MRKLAVVLGASTGVGAAIAKRLARYEGFDVIGFHRGRHPEEAATVEKSNAPGRVELFEADVGSTHEKVVIGAECITRPVSLLVHSLSGASVGSALELSAYQTELTFNRLAHSFLWWVQELHHRKLLAPAAHIVALSNPCPDFYLTNSGVIGAAKAALEAYVKMLAVELGRDGYFVNGIRFSTVVTPALKRVLGPETLQQLTLLHSSIVPWGRIQVAEDVAAFVAQLARDYWMNGAIVDLTGGSTLTLLDYAFNGPTTRTRSE